MTCYHKFMSIEHATRTGEKYQIPYYGKEAGWKEREVSHLWEQSDIVTQQRERKAAGLPVRVALLDIDSTTWAGDAEQTDQAVKALRERGFSIVYLTSLS